MKRKILRLFFKILRKNPGSMPMVQYWKTKESAAAKVIVDKSGALVMKIEGEKEIFPGFPRGHSLFGTLSKFKHEIKNQLFNESWALLEQGKTQEAIKHVKQLVVEGVKIKDSSPYGGLTYQLGEDCLDRVRYDMVPSEKMVAPVREIWRTLSVLELKEPRLRWLKETLTFILQEDDAYRFRFQWLIGIFRPRWWNDPVKLLTIALEELENAEILGDMKERVRLWRRITLLALKDPHIHSLFKDFCKEVDWNKLKLTKADKYHFRGKYFKVDLDKFEY